MENKCHPSEDAEAPRTNASKVLHLTGQDSIMFVDALLSPPEPNEHLRAALEDFRAFFGRNDDAPDFKAIEAFPPHCTTHTKTNPPE